MNEGVLSCQSRLCDALRTTTKHNLCIDGARVGLRLCMALFGFRQFLAIFDGGTEQAESLRSMQYMQHMAKTRNCVI